jgi:ribonuclease HI
MLLSADNELIKEEHGHEMDTTNNRMELVAAIRGLQYASASVQAEHIIIYTDSQYVMGPYTMDRKIIANSDLFDILNLLVEQLNPSFRWVKGHSGCRFNNAVDMLARIEAQTY